MGRSDSLLVALLVCSALLGTGLAIGPEMPVPVATSEAASHQAADNSSQPTESPPSTNPTVTLIDVGPTDTRLWPYTSKRQSFDQRTLVINAVVTEDPETARQMLTWRTPEDWEPGPNDTAADAPTDWPRWQSTHGATRYTYVETAARQDGLWLEEHFQLHTGTYLGSRHHVRGYAPDEAEWTALQVHTEYWDWFRLRHTVTDVDGTARLLATDFEAREGFAVNRDHAMDRGPLSQGLVVVSAMLGFGIAFATRPGRVSEALTEDWELSRVAGLVFLVALGGPLLVRGAGVGLEQLYPTVPPKFFTTFLFPALAIAYPAIVHRTARHGTPFWVGLAALVGAGAGFAGDFVAVDVMPPERLLVHRAVLATAVSLIAVGGARPRDGYQPVSVAGAVIWVGAVLLMLVGLW